MPTTPYERVTRKRHPTRGMELVAGTALVLLALGRHAAAGLVLLALVAIALGRQVVA